MVAWASKPESNFDHAGLSLIVIESVIYVQQIKNYILKYEFEKTFKFVNSLKRADQNWFW